MTTPAPAYQTASSAIGLAKETVRHTAVPPAFWAKVKAPDWKPNQSMIDDDTLQGSMVHVYDTIPGLRYDSHSWQTFPYMDVLPLYVLAELGSPDTLTTAATGTTLAASSTVGATTISCTATVAANSWITIGTGGIMETRYTTGVTGAGPFTVTVDFPLQYAHNNGAAVAGLTGHDFSLLNNTGSTGNQPPSLTISDFDGEEWRQLTGAQLDKLDFKIVPNKTIDMSTTWFADAATTPSTPTQSFSAESMPPGWSVFIAVGGTPLNYVESLDLSFSRGVKPIEAFTGNQNYYEYFAGPLMATGKITVIEQSGAPELTQYLAGTKQTLEVLICDRQSGWGARFFSTKSLFRSGQVTRGKEWVEASLDIQFLPSTADATAGGVSPINVSIGNGQVATY